MKTLCALLIASLLSACGCAKKQILETKPATVDQPHEVQPEVKNEEPIIKAATPEDPGPIATIVGPMALLQQQEKSAQVQQPETVRREPLPIDHPVFVEAGKPKHLLHNVFSVNNHTQFAFLVPPHQGKTRLRGTFRSFTKRDDPDSTDRTANVDLLLLNEQEFNQFLHGQPQTVTYELDSVHNESVDWRVPTTFGEPEKYHLIFSNAGTGKKFIEADFTVSFE